MLLSQLSGPALRGAARRRLPSRRRASQQPGLAQLLSAPLELIAETGAKVVNTALAVSGSPKVFREEPPVRAASSAESGSRDGWRSESYFWRPDDPESPFMLGRDKFLEQLLLCTSHDSRDIVPDADVEEYVDTLVSEGYLHNVALPSNFGRPLYIRVVRIVLRVILNACQLFEGQQALGKSVVILKQPSKKSRLNCQEQAIDPDFIKRLAERAVDDHQFTSHYLKELGIPMPVVRMLYRDITALSARLVLDVCLSVHVRWLGHSITLQVSPDEHICNAPGWDVDLASGVFGLFKDDEKRKQARTFVEELMQDEAVLVQELPRAFQRELYTRAVMVQLNLLETSMNHFRVHVAGMAFRPALMPEDHKQPE